MRGKSGFTLLEMLVVIGILGILMATSFTGLARARVMARIARANSEMRMLIGAVLAYEAATEEELHTLNLSGDDGMEATESNLSELLGQGKNKIVFLNAQLRGSPLAFRDPWGTPYKVRVLRDTSSASSTTERFDTAITFPNRNRAVP